jgi:RNA polymerase sigma factor (sigma-70 family)
VKYAAIISEFQKDLNKGLAMLFKEYGQTLFGYSVHTWKLNEDEAYEALYKTLQSVGKVITRYEFESDAHFKNWIFKIHKNNILQFLRSKKGKEEIYHFSYSDWENEVNDLGEDAFGISEFKEVIEKVDEASCETPDSPLMTAMKKALLKVSEQERELLMLRMNEYSYDEISQMLGIENKQLKVKFNRAKAKIEKLTLEILKETSHDSKK